MHSNPYDLINYNKWNRRLMNLFWIFSVISLITEIILFISLSKKNFLGMAQSEYICTKIFIPTVLMFSFTFLCEALIMLSQKKYRNIQPYIITFTCSALSIILLVIHSGVTILCAAFILPIISSLVYDNKSVLLATFLFSIFSFAAVYFFYLTNIDLPTVSIHIGDAITNFALIIAAYLICKIILNRCREIINVVVSTQRSAYELEMAKSHAEALAETRARFLANMSHEIRTPMNGIIGLAELALNAKTLSQKEEDYLSKIKSSAIGLLNIINDILDISKIDAKNINLDNIPFSLSDILTECEALISHGAIQKGLRLYFYNEAHINKNIKSDPTRLRQVLLNLLSNAVKFTYQGSVTLLVKLDDTDSTGDKVSVYFEISDTGIGITSEHLEKIFEPFKQADDSITRSFGGTGLGLTITKGIIEAMGGKIIVSSIPNIGSRFSFSLEFELSDEEQKNDNIDNDQIEHPTFTGYVLLCEDNAISQQVARENLEKLGLNVILAENGKEGVSIVSEREQENKPFDIILMDINMPVMDGLQAAREILRLNVKTPIIAITANVTCDDRKEYINAGITEFLYKPFGMQELWSCLLKYLTPTGTTVTKAVHLKKDDNAPVNKVLGLENNIGSEDIYIKSIKIFIEEQPKLLKTLEQAIAEVDFPLAYRITHTAKNNAKIIGASRLAELSTILEESLRYDGSYFRASMIDEYKEELFKVIDYIQKGSL